MDEISKRVFELDEKIENYSNPSFIHDIEQQPDLPFDLPGGDQPMGIENYLKGLEYVSKEVEAQKKERYRISKRMEKRLEKEREKSMEEEQEECLPASRKSEKTEIKLIYNKKVLSMLDVKDKHLAVQYYDILKCIVIYDNMPGERIEMFFRTAQKLIDIKRVFFLRNIFNNNIEPTKRKLFSACLTINILWETVEHVVALYKGTTDFADLSTAKLLQFDDVKFLLDYFEDKEYSNQKTLVLPRPYKSFVRDLYLSVYGEGERQAEAKKELGLALANDDIFVR
jgi:hypothetical protein